MSKKTKPLKQGARRVFLETKKICGPYAPDRLRRLGVPEDLIQAAVCVQNEAEFDIAEDVIIKWFMEAEDLTEELAIHVLNGGRLLCSDFDAC